jgi:hypothetical protein
MLFKSEDSENEIDKLEAKLEKTEEVKEDDENE